MKRKKKDNNGLFYGIIFLAFAFTGMFLVDPGFKPNNIIQGNWDISDQVISNGYQQYLVEEKDFDYSHALIQDEAKHIKESTNNVDDAVRETMKFVARHTQYSATITVNDCYNEKASDVLISGKGDCVSMSRLNTALLRAQGIPARTMGGCLSAKLRCSPIFSAIPGEVAKTVEMTEGDFKKRGFLHEWVEVWTPKEGWFIVESTSGQKYPMDCVTYLEFGYDTNSRDRCVITDRNFWQQCSVY